MNNLLKSGIRLCLRKFESSCKVMVQSGIPNTLTPAYSRTLWHMCSTSRINGDLLKPVSPSECCRCGCLGLLHTGGERELVEFLQEEITEEKKSLKMKSLPAELEGFAISADQAELTFTKKNQLETITVSMNVNHSVDNEEVGEDGSYSEEMKSKPAFEVDIVRDQKTLSFTCAFTEITEPSDKDTADLYEITEVTYFEGDWKEKTYSVAADLLDETLYDLFMLLLNEKGITKKFVAKVSEIATSHEHSQYIGLLENVRKFATTN